MDNKKSIHPILRIIGIITIGVGIFGFYKGVDSAISFSAVFLGSTLLGIGYIEGKKGR